MDERIVINSRMPVIIIAEHWFKSHHLKQQHANGEDICFWGDIRIIIPFLEFLHHFIDTFRS
jgi:hypothetical protein